MKKFIKLTILILFANSAIAQFPITSTTSLENPDNDPNFLRKGNYAQDTANEREQYVGVWEYNQGDILFQINVKKMDQQLTKLNNSDYYSYCDVVAINYKLVINGTTLYDNLYQSIYSPGDTYSTAIKKGDDSYLIGSFIDKSTNVISQFTISRLNTSPQKIIVNITDGSYTLLDPIENYDPNQPIFTVPTGEIEMVKID